MHENHDVDMRLYVRVPMRDGVNLSTDLYLPRTTADGPPYSNNLADLVCRGRDLANRGYLCVIQDVLGRRDSEGHDCPFFNEAQDGYDTQEWIRNQSWSNGRIGMYRCFVPGGRAVGQRR